MHDPFQARYLTKIRKIVSREKVVIKVHCDCGDRDHPKVNDGKILCRMCLEQADQDNTRKHWQKPRQDNDGSGFNEFCQRQHKDKPKRREEGKLAEGDRIKQKQENQNGASSPVCLACRKASKGKRQQCAGSYSDQIPQYHRRFNFLPEVVDIFNGNETEIVRSADGDDGDAEDEDRHQEPIERRCRQHVSLPDRCGNKQGWQKKRDSRCRSRKSSALMIIIQIREGIDPKVT